MEEAQVLYFFFDNLFIFFRMSISLLIMCAFFFVKKAFLGLSIQQGNHFMKTISLEHQEELFILALMSLSLKLDLIQTRFLSLICNNHLSINNIFIFSFDGLRELAGLFLLVLMEKLVLFEPIFRATLLVFKIPFPSFFFF